MSHHGQPGNPLETIKELIVAFVLAMTFRGFVTEGFVIPTGSMAPTLMGQHFRFHSDRTGYEFPVGVDPRKPVPTTDQERRLFASRIVDPMLGRLYRGMDIGLDAARPRMGDRILVLKSLYPFFEPDRFDIVVFKNPTDPLGDAQNYIKRLIGLPGEAIWLVDGDVFVADAENAADYAAFDVQRKPEHVQRAVWQPVHHLDYIPAEVERWDQPYFGLPWTGSQGWRINAEDWENGEDMHRAFRCETAEPSHLDWNNQVVQLDDWSPYNMLFDVNPGTFYVHDVRVMATITPDEAGLETTLEITARQHQYQFVMRDGELRMRIRHEAYAQTDLPEEGWEGSEPAAIPDFKPGVPVTLEFWHVDQSMSVYINGERIGDRYEYEWRPLERLQAATGRADDDIDELARLKPSWPTEIRWTFQGSPFTLERLRLDRDLYYRFDRLNGNPLGRPPALPEYADRVAPGQRAAATHPDTIAVLNGDQFFMLGDNSPASSDSRLWGAPDPLIAAQIDPTPFVVNRKLLLGKAYVVYFPSPLPITEGSSSVIPDFGRLRFIR